MSSERLFDFWEALLEKLSLGSGNEGGPGGLGLRFQDLGGLNVKGLGSGV